MVIIWKLSARGIKTRLLGQGKDFESAAVQAVESGNITLYDDLNTNDRDALMLHIEAAKNDYFVEYIKNKGGLLK